MTEIESIAAAVCRNTVLVACDRWDATWPLLLAMGAVFLVAAVALYGLLPRPRRR